MKKKIFYLLCAVVALLLTLTAVLPFVIESKKVQLHLIQRIEQYYPVEAKVAHAQLSFFPSPHIKLVSLAVAHKDFSLLIPEAAVYPSWRILIGQPALGRIHVTHPQFSLLNDVLAKQDAAPQRKGDFNWHSLPRFTLHVTDGSLQMPAVTTPYGMISATHFTEIDATVSVQHNRFAVTWDSSPSFGKQFDFAGSLALPDRTGQGKMTVSHLDLARLYSTSAPLPFSFIPDTSDFSATLHYTPAAGLALEFNGDIPDVILTGDDQSPVPLLIKDGNFKVATHKDFFEVSMASLVLAEPALQLAGSVSYYLPKTGAEKHVKIDLQGKEIDATTLRQKILTLFGGNHVADTVCEIVQNGYASSASYTFDSPIRDFADIHAMTLDVDIDRADIHLKYVPIDLVNASGKIRIKDGDLTGWDITTEVKDSIGTKGSFLVGLAENNWGLKVDVDINANLAELPQILQEIITVEDVVEELHLVTATGRGDAHLHIGDTLTDFNVIVDVTGYDNPEIRYDRIPAPIAPQEGHLQITGSEANWSNLSLRIGNHSIRETTGQISWKEPSITFALTSITGLFDNNAILTELMSYPTLAKPLQAVATSMTGTTLLHGKIKGNFFAPASYTYDFDAQVKDVTIASPRLPEQLSIISAQAKVTDTAVSIAEATGLLLGKPVQLQGRLSHANWMAWSGDLLFDGELQAPVTEWLRQEQLIPEKLLIKTPAVLEKMQVKWTDTELVVQGGIQPVGTGTTLALNIRKTADVLTGDFNIHHKDDDSQVRFVAEPAQNAYDFHINGALSGQALTDLLDDPFISFNTISGKMDIHTRFPGKDTPPAFTFAGNLDITQLTLLFNKNERLDQSLTFSVTGHDTVLDINTFDIHVNHELLTAHGQFKSEGWDGHLQLDIKSPTINTDTVEQIVERIDTFISSRLGLCSTTPPIECISRYNLNGSIDFNFDTFIVPFGEDVKNGSINPKYKFPITPLQGRYTFNNTDSALNIRNSMVCGLEIESSFTWLGKEKTHKEVSAQTPVQNVVDLSDFLRCFNSDAVIKGPMTFKGHAKSNTDEVKQGYFSLTSEHGTIYKFAALTKVLSILNIKGLSGSIWQKGYYYNKLELSGFIKNNILHISQFTIDGDGVDIVGQGTFDLDKMEYDMVLYVVPFATVGSLVTKVPIVGRVLGGKEGRIISVPVKITGPLANPDVSIMDASAVGKATGKWIWETVTFPFDWTFEEEKTTEQEELLNQPEQAVIPQGQ